MLTNFKYLFFLFLVTSFFSCEEKEEVNIIIEDNFISPIVNEIKTEDVLYVDRIECYDSLCIMINRKMFPCLHLYNRFDFIYQKAFGNSGHGPTDFLFPFFLYSSLNANDLLLYDVNLAAFKDVNLKKVLTNETDAFKTKPIPQDLLGSPNMFILSDSTFVGNKDNGDGLFFIKRKDGQLEWVEFPSSLVLPETDFTVMNMNRITINEVKSKVAVGMSFYNKVFLYDFNKKLLKSVQIGENKVTPMVIDDYYLSGDNYLWCKEIKSTDNKIYLLMQRIKEEDISNPGNSTSTILVLDWNLDYVSTYQFSHYIMAFTVDTLANRIIYAAMNAEGGSDLFYFNIADC